MSENPDATNRFDPTAPPAKLSRGQRLLAAALLLLGAALVAFGLTLDWLSVSISGGMDFGFELPETSDTVWDAVSESGYLLAAAAGFAALASITAVVAARPSAGNRLAGLVGLFASIAAIAAGAGLAITYFRWNDLNSTFGFDFDADLGFPAVAFELEIGVGVWVAVAGAILIAAGLTLHLARIKSVSRDPSIETAGAARA